MVCRKGFTLAEVLVALVIISTVSAAVLKLCALAELSLSEARTEKELVREAQSIRTELLIGDISDSGTSGDITWNFTHAENEVMGRDFGKLNFDAVPQGPEIQPKCMELAVTKKMLSGRERTIILYSPEKESLNIREGTFKKARDEKLNNIEK